MLEWYGAIFKAHRSRKIIFANAKRTSSAFKRRENAGAYNEGLTLDGDP